MAKNNETTLYILHGWTKDITKWQPFLAELKKHGIKPVLLKIPGLTGSLKKPWYLNDYMVWFQKKVGDERNVYVLAHSFGGRVAVRFDVKNPNVIRKLILMDSAGIRPDNIKAILKRASFKALAKIGKSITKSTSARKMLYSLAREKDYYEADRVLAQTMHNIIEEDQRKELEFVKAHTLLIWGSNDKTTPISDGRMMNKQIMGSNLKIVDGAGHSPHYSHPEEVSRYIAEFLHHQT